MEKNETKIAVFGGGCFWCTEAVFGMLKGVVSVEPGYTGGDPFPDGRGPTYDEVSLGNTGYVESTKIEYDPVIISYNDLLSVFFNTHDPTTLNRQGNDIGSQYRSAIFYSDEEQKTAAEALIKESNDKRAYEKPAITEVRPLTIFYPAEDYHKKYYENHKDEGYCQIVIAPKLEKLQKSFGKLLNQK